MKKLIISGVVAASLIVNSGLAVFAQTKNYNSSKSNTAVTEVKEAVITLVKTHPTWKDKPLTLFKT